MSQPPIIISNPDSALAVAYLARHLGGSCLMNCFGMDILTSECKSISVATASPPPPGANFHSSIGGASGPCYAWLIQKAISYLQSGPSAVVLFEDLISSPSDEFLANRAHPPFWRYKERIFWPVLAAQANNHNVEESKAWTAGFRTIAYFVEVEPTIAPVLGTRSLSGEELRKVAASLRGVVVDAFDGEGYIDWQREMREGCSGPANCEGANIHGNGAASPGAGEQ